VARGQVEYARWIDGYGRTIIVNHGGGYYTLYAHLAETLVSESQAVEPGQILAGSATRDPSTCAKLHFEVRVKADASIRALGSPADASPRTLQTPQEDPARPSPPPPGADNSVPRRGNHGHACA
jgi:murein DD-endopeptidase MepM/ murein hydrolase activator NlpD